MAVPTLAPCPRCRSGRISELYTHANGPIPTENAHANATTTATATAATAASSLAPPNAANTEPSTRREAVMPPVLARSRGRRRTRAVSAMAMRMELALATPNTTLRPRRRVLGVTPAAASTPGPYSTTESMSEACWKNCSISTMVSTRCMPGLVATSFRAPPPLPPTELAATTSSISCSRCSASAGGVRRPVEHHPRLAAPPLHRQPPPRRRGWSA
ncbi:Os10g0558850, partial [Oryza sativa Japonica Group]